MAKVVEMHRKDGQGGVFSPQEVGAQQAGVTVQAVPVVAWDHRNNSFGILNQGFLAEACKIAERMDVIGRLVLPVTVTIPDTAVAGDEFEDEITIPDGVLGYFNRLTVVCPAAGADGSANFNIRVEQVGGTPWNYLPANLLAMGATTTIDLVDLDQLGTPLRLVSGDKLILSLRVTVAHTVEKDYVLTAFGSRARRIV
jgi:hypothetical protein